MKKELRTEFLAKFDQISIDTIRAFSGTTMSEAQIADWWKTQPFREAFQAHCEQKPDEEAPGLHNDLQRFPAEFRKQLRKMLRQSADGFGGRPPLLTDTIRHQVCEEVKRRQDRGLKLKRAIEETAPLYRLTPKQLTGIWKHRTRYKGCPENGITASRKK